jgi:hypothetical protein
LPDTLPLLLTAPDVDDPAEVEDELPPQAVASMQIAASATTQWKRFIETLSFPFGDRRKADYLGNI